MAPSDRNLASRLDVKERHKDTIVKFFRMLLATVMAVVVAVSAPAACAAAAETSSVVFKASESDADGNFTLSMTIQNATFNTFQFVIRYDKATLTPVDASGAPTAAFSAFAQKRPGIDWLSTVGTSIDMQKGLIDFTGFVSPGNGVSTDGLADIPGYANLGKTGVALFDFHFRKTGTADAVIEIAAQNAAKPYSTFLPEGAVLLDAGEKLPVNVQFDLPSTVGAGGSYTPSPPVIETSMTKEERLRNTIALQIGNYGAASNGALIRIDPDNPKVKPYIDENDRTMVPVRFVAERLNADVDWNPQTRQITILTTDRTIVMTVGSKAYTINGIAYTMDTEPIIVQGWDRTVVPIRFVSEALGRAVEWDPVNRLVLITDQAQPWQPDREAEQQATQSILLVISDLVRDFT